MTTKTFYTTFTYDKKFEFFVKALIIDVPLTAIMLGEVVIKKINGDIGKVNELAELSKQFSEHNEVGVASNEQQGRVDAIVARLDDVQRRVKEIEGPGSSECPPYNVAPEDELEALPELVLEPAHEQAVEQVPEDQVINPYDLRQHKNIFSKIPFCKHRTAEEVAKDLKWCYVLILVLVGLLWYRT
ncbi:hypothetical protein E8E11_003935 [Didymella keratinophila]|nr:hypothetical protein E8E11_003935 [Didymella keratinophila]